MIKEADKSADLVYVHTIYSRNNMGQKCEGNSGLWALNKMS